MLLAAITHCEKETPEVCHGDNYLFRSRAILIHGLGVITKYAEVEENFTYMKASIADICGRLGWYNESPHATNYPGNDVRPILNQKTHNELLFKRESNSIPTIIIQLEASVTVGCISTYGPENSAGIGIFGELQRMTIINPNRIANETTNTNKKTMFDPEVVVQFLPFHRKSELTKLDVNPPMGYLTCIPFGHNATPITCAAMHFIRKWVSLRTLLDDNKFILLTEMLWRSPPQDNKRGDRRAKQDIMIKIVYTGGDTKALNNQELLMAREALKKDAGGHGLLHLNGLRIRYHQSLEDARATKGQYKWILDPTPYTEIRYLYHGVTAADVMHCIHMHFPNLKVTHEIGAIVILPRIEFQMRAGTEMKRTSTSAVILWLYSRMDIDTTKVEELLQNTDGDGRTVTVMDVTNDHGKILDLPGRDRFVEAGNWFKPLESEAVPTPVQTTPTVSHCASFNSPSLAQRLFGDKHSSDYKETTEGDSITASRELTVGTASGVKRRACNDETGLVRKSSNTDQELTKMIGSLTDQLARLNNEVSLLKEQNTQRTLADREQEAILDAKLHAVQEGAAAAAKQEVSRLFETSDRLAKLGKANSDMQISHRYYREAKLELEAQEQLYALEAPGKGGAITRDQAKAQISVNRARNSLDANLTHFRNAKDTVLRLHQELNVDASPILSQYDE